MCHVKKTKVIPITTEATGTISKSFRKYLNNILGKSKHPGNAENSHTGRCAFALENADTEVQTVYRGRQHNIRHKL
jgi:hypothetical protein